MNDAQNEVTVAAEDGAVVVESVGPAGDKWVWWTPEDAREFAAHLLAAADEAEGQGAPQGYRPVTWKRR